MGFELVLAVGTVGKKGLAGRSAVEGCLFWFLCSSQICVPPYSFLKEAFWGAYIVFVKVIIWVNSRLVHCWAGG